MLPFIKPMMARGFPRAIDYSASDDVVTIA